MDDLQKQRIEDFIQEICALTRMPPMVVRGYVDAALSVLKVSPGMRTRAQSLLEKTAGILRGLTE